MLDNTLRYLVFITAIFINLSLIAQNENMVIDNNNFNNNGDNNNKPSAKNVLGTNLQSCCFEPLTGYFRDGFCNTNYTDYGTHTVCAIMTDEFLKFSKAAGNDLSTPKPQWNFPGLKAGDKWCLCAMRWFEAYENGAAPKIILESTNQKTLEYIPIEALKEFAF